MEVLISVLILGIGMLGIAAMQATALRYGQSSLETSQAVMQTYSILERMRANAGAADAYDTGGLLCDASVAGATLAVNDLNAWITSMKQTMGTAADTTTCGEVDAVGGGVYEVTVQWDDSRAGDGSGAREISVETTL